VHDEARAIHVNEPRADQRVEEHIRITVPTHTLRDVTCVNVLQLAALGVVQAPPHLKACRCPTAHTRETPKLRAKLPVLRCISSD
jgi:hypothetical protein